MSDPKVLRLGGHEFRCIEAFPVGLLFDLVEVEKGDAVEALIAYRDLLLTLVEDDEHERFNALLRDRREAPSFRDLQESVDVLMKEYVARPTARPSLSPSGGSQTDGEPKHVSLSRGTDKAGPASSKGGR